MAYTGGEYSFQELYKELKKKVFGEGVQSDYEYESLIEDLIEDKKKQGFLSEDEDLEQLKSDLMLMWPEVEREIQDKNKNQTQDSE